jgi:hypothetical protein
MLNWQPNQVVILTPGGTVIVARRLYERLEARMLADDLGLLRDLDWWRQMSELVSGIQIVSLPTRERQ